MTDSAVLPKARQLFETFEANGVQYCHWKSNEHLEAGLVGHTDLDVLVERCRAAAAQQTLADLGFKRLRNACLAGHPGMEDYLGFDEDIGALLHVHLHYQLVIGERRVKSYRLPIENHVLAMRRRDPETGVFTTDSAMELFLLVVRYGLKFRRWDLLPWRDFPGTEFEAEYEWLRERTDVEEVCSIARSIVEPSVVSEIETVVEGAVTASSFRRLNKRLRSTLAPYRRYCGSEAAVRSLVRGGRLALSLFSTRFSVPRSFRRSFTTGGAVVVFIGADGAGKSTHTESTTRWLSWKVDVVPVYFGSGEGPASLLRRPLIWVKSRRDRLGGGVGSGDGTEWVSGPIHVRVGKVLWALTLAREKRKKLVRAWRARNRGLVVVADRYPQDQVAGCNDGPLLSAWTDASDPVRRALARWEGEPYRRASKLDPDLIIKLSISSDVAVNRAPDMSREELHRRIETIESLKFDDAEVVHLNANRAVETIEPAVRRVVWECL
jgi:thymidylate kinase